MSVFKHASPAARPANLAKLRLVQFAVLLAVAAVITVAAWHSTVQTKRADAARAKIEQAMAPFHDPAMVQLAQRTAFTQSARTQAPTLTAHMSDAQILNVARETCREIDGGMKDTELSVYAVAKQQRFGGINEASAFVNAARYLYCPDR